MDLVVRRAQRTDTAPLAQLHVETVTHAYAGIFPAEATAPTPADLEPDYASLIVGGADVWLVERGGSVVGAIVLVSDVDVPAGWRIERFNVHPTHQSNGLGSSLYGAALGAARNRGIARLNLWVLQENSRARNIYESWGWTLVPGRTLENDPPEVLDVLYELVLDEPSAPTS